MDLTPSQHPAPQHPANASIEDLTPPPPLEPPQASVPRPRNPFFFGPFGLRAIWSILIYLAILAGIVGIIFAIGYGIHVHREHVAALAAARAGRPAPPSRPFSFKPGSSGPQAIWPMILGEGAVFLVYLFASWLMALIERRKFTSFGLGGAHRFGRFLMGAFWGIAAISLLVLALHSFHFLSFDSRADHGTAILYWGATQLIGFLLVGLTEEYTFRGYLQFTLTRGMVFLGNRTSPKHARTIAFWVASLLTSALFLLAHTSNSGENWLGLFQVFLAGVVFVVALWRTGSLWWGIGFHMAWDWGQSFVYGVPDSGLLMQGRLFNTHASGNPLFSGGTVGPEGSVLCIPIFLLAILVLFFTHPSPQPPLELPDQPQPALLPESSPLSVSPDAPSAIA